MFPSLLEVGMGYVCRGAALARTARFRFFVALFASFMLMGMGYALIGPSMTELSVQTGVALSSLVFILTARSLGVFAGTIVGGQLIDRFSLRGKTIQFCALLTATCLLIVIPLVPWVGLLTVLCFLQGLSLGVVDNLSQILLIRLMGAEVGPYMQALHAAFGIGAFVAPLVMSPFLAGTYGVDPLDVAGAGDDGTSTDYRYAYFILAAFCAVVTAVMAGYMWRDERPQFFLLAQSSDATADAEVASPPQAAGQEDSAAVTTTDPEAQAQTDDVVWSNGGVLAPAATTSSQAFLSVVRGWVSKQVSEFDWVQGRVVALVGGFLFLYVGTESGFGNYIFSYATKSVIGMSSSDAAILNSLFWFSFACGRVVAIPMSMRFTPAQMISMDLALCTAVVLLLLLFHRSAAMLWIGTVLYGLSVASIYPSAINYVESSSVRVTGAIMSALTVCASLGEAIIPLLMGLSFDWSATGPLGLFLITLIVAIAAAALFFLIYKMVPPPTSVAAAATDATPTHAGSSGAVVPATPTCTSEEAVEVASTTLALPLDTTDCEGSPLGEPTATVHVLSHVDWDTVETQEEQ